MGRAVSHLIIVMLVVFGGWAPAKTQAAYELAWAAYHRPDYASALKLLKPLAEDGHEKAQYYLGRMFANGHGVEQDYVTAYQWLDASASATHRFASEDRDRLTTPMTPEQIAQARKQADAWSA
jgi:TPR repeat protein